MSAAEEGLDYQKKISQRHFETAAKEVVESKRAMSVNPDDEAVKAAETAAEASAVQCDMSARIGALEKTSAELCRQLQRLKKELGTGKEPS